MPISPGRMAVSASVCVFLLLASSQSTHAQSPEKPPTPATEAAANTESATTESATTGSGPSIGLADLETWALSHNPAIARAHSIVSAAHGNWVQVGLPPNPILSYQGQQIGSRGLAEQDGVGLSQEIVRGQKLRLNQNIAFQEYNRAQQELATQTQRVLTDVRLAYSQALVAQRQLEVTERLLQISHQAVKTSRALLAAKDVSRTDVLQAQLEADNTEIMAANSRNRHQAAWRTLAAVVGIADLNPQPLAGNLEALPRDFDFDATLQRYLQVSPEIAIAHSNIERARWVLARAQAEPRPNVTVEGLVNFRDNGIGGRSDGAIGVSIPVPFWNRNQGAISQACHQAMAAEHELAQLQLDLRNRLAAVFERYRNSRNQVEFYQGRILPAAQETLKLTQSLYEAGEIGFINLLTAQRTFVQTNLSYLESLRELRLSEVEIDGMLLSGSLASQSK